VSDSTRHPPARSRSTRPDPSDTPCATNRSDAAEDDDGSVSGRMSSTNRSANGMIDSRELMMMNSPPRQPSMMRR
jgi:hypothetical protein